MATALRIRPAAMADLPYIVQLINQQAKSGKILKRSSGEVRKLLRSFFIAEIEGKPVGCCALEIYNRKLAEIRSLVVEPRFQKQGIASTLIAHAVKIAKRRRIYEVLAITDRASIFSKRGFSQQLQGQKALFLRP